ncbi:MAG: hypothetical protein WCF85_21955 [Rhodospirillaceae bacterium]
MPEPPAADPTENVLVHLTRYPADLDGVRGDHLAAVLSEVATERLRRDRKQGRFDYDDGRKRAYWTREIVDLLSRTGQADFRDKLIKTAPWLSPLFKLMIAKAVRYPQAANRLTGCIAPFCSCPPT